MEAVESIEHRQRSIHLIAVVEGADIRVGIGFWVDGSSETILRPSAGTDRWKETADSSKFGGPFVIELQFRLPYLMVVLYGILHTLLNRP